MRLTPPRLIERSAPRTTVAWGLALLLAGGCEQPERIVTESPTSDEAVAIANRLTGADNGLEVREWLVDDDPVVIAGAVAALGEPALPGADTDARWRRNGLRFVRVPADRLDVLLESLGGSTVNLQGWHGQVTRWRAVHDLDVGRGCAVAIDGRVQRFRNGQLSLMMRSWTMPMETGPRIQFELIPAFEPAVRPSDYAQLLGEVPLGPEPIPSMAVELRLEPGFAYVLTYAEPDETWFEESLEDADASASTSDRRDTGSAPDIGPPVDAPPTLGQFLLSRRTLPPRRGVIVFVPRVPPSMGPEGTGALGVFESTDETPSPEGTG